MIMTKTAKVASAWKVNYKRAFIETKKKNLPPPRKLRCKHVNRPRKEFAYDALELKSAIELPCPTSDAARSQVPNPYIKSRLTHERGGW